MTVNRAPVARGILARGHRSCGCRAQRIDHGQRDISIAGFSGAVEVAIVGDEDEACAGCANRIQEAFGSGDIGIAAWRHH